VLTSPAPSSVLSGPNVTFSWAAAPGATGYSLLLGSTGVGSSNLYSSGQITATSAAATGLPTNGSTVYARLYTYFSGAQSSADYTYTATTPSSLTSPVSGSTLAGPNVTFAWSSATGATGYTLYLGTTGVGSSNIYSSGQVAGTSIAVAGIPTNGAVIYARLFTIFNGAQVSSDYTYTAATQSLLTTPTPGSAFTSPNMTFAWTAAAGATGYSLNLGSTGVGSSDLYSSALQTGTSLSVNGLPSNGQTIYARLFTSYNGVLVSADFTYAAVSQAVLGSPAPGTVLPGNSVTFAWTQPAGATAYTLNLGSTGVGSSNLYSSGSIAGTSVTVSGLPINGETIYARLYTSFNGVLTSTDYVYSATAPAVIQSPANGSVLPGASVTFSWTTAPGTIGYNLWVGTSTTGAGEYNIYASPQSTATSVTVNNLPTTGVPIYVRLYTKFSGGVMNYGSYTYTAQ
jgi:hypothetical protein